ncbi:MAG: STAS-like domain-containing protein [Hyphomicrobiales bacterium]|nr:STAS-like domain-containing protein [Hyphomicrobiales bacterium]MBV9052719.1 STAS-like domain-containing protein [Hyphomicrobiales bacterium]MBV9138883.1 STAS-like domain-containing protein [Hyphomicrobiales bacterium]MBV9588211.1 STAS-like domain-containing protein [Hyphomicrobiales bacterium]MBV9976603.1 STAS-like domain-containing protein [Hyphomicrobiales bacterium]
MIRILDIVPGADTGDQGAAVLEHVLCKLREHQDVVISFEGVMNATPSFVNASFVELLDSYPLEEIRRRIKVVKSTRQINEVIKERLYREAEVRAA